MKINRDTVLGATILAVITVAVGNGLNALGGALQSVSSQPGFWPSVANVFVSIGGFFGFTTSTWFLCLAAFAAGVFVTISTDRYLRKRMPAQSAGTPAAVAATPQKPNDTVDSYYVWENAKTSLKRVQVLIAEAVDSQYKSTAEKTRDLQRVRAQLEAQMLTIEKAGVRLPEVVEYDVLEMLFVFRLLKELQPFLDAFGQSAIVSAAQHFMTTRLSSWWAAFSATKKSGYGRS